MQFLLLNWIMQLIAEFYEMDIVSGTFPHMQKGGIYELPLCGSTEIPKLERLPAGEVGILNRLEDPIYETICSINLTMQLGIEYLMFGDCGFIFSLRPDGIDMPLKKGELVKGAFYFIVDGLKLCDMGNYYLPRFYYRWRVDKIERLTMVQERPDVMETVTISEIYTTEEDFNEENIDQLTLTLLDPMPELRIGDKTLRTKKEFLSRLN